MSDIKHRAQGHRFIDPPNCGSAVGYYVHITKYEGKSGSSFDLNATVRLSDCNRFIEWIVNDVDKVDEAIAVLQEFRKQYIAAERRLANLKEEKQ